jgi:hypothetical protein
MSNLTMKPEFNDLTGEQSVAAGAPGAAGQNQAADPGVLACNPLGGRRLRRAGLTPRLAPPSDDGFRLFRVY